MWSTTHVCRVASPVGLAAMIVCLPAACSEKPAESSTAENPSRMVYLQPIVGDERTADPALEGGPVHPDVPAEVRGELLRLVGEYRQWERVSDAAAWAPTDCLARPPAGIQTSDSDDPDTHGGKLYYLYARHDHAYVYLNFVHDADAANTAAPVGQLIVKESYQAVEATSDEMREQRDTPIPLQPESERAAWPYRWALPELSSEFAVKDGRIYRCGDRRELFVMFKTPSGATAPEWSDEGWVYATLPADGSRIEQIGRIASCMRCHADAPFDRCFGLPRARAMHRARQSAQPE